MDSIRVKFNECSFFTSREVYADDAEDWFTDNEEDDQLEEGTEEDIVFHDMDSDYLEPSPEVIINDGRSHMPGQSRFRRCRCFSNVRLDLLIKCEIDDASCITISIGQKGKFLA